jgi:hypothetical protein
LGSGIVDAAAEEHDRRAVSVRGGADAEGLALNCLVCNTFSARRTRKFKSRTRLRLNVCCRYSLADVLHKIKKQKPTVTAQDDCRANRRT